MLLAVGAHEEGGNVHDLLADANVALLDQHARVVNRLGEAELEHDRLETALEESLGVEREHVIELVLGLVLLRGGRRGCVGGQRGDDFSTFLGFQLQTLARFRDFRAPADGPTDALASPSAPHIHK